MPNYHGYKYSMSDVPKDLGGQKEDIMAIITKRDDDLKPLPRWKEMIDDHDRAEALELENAKLRAALCVARDYLALSLGSPAYEGPDPYPIIEAALKE